jgi:ferredoxin
VKVLGIYYFSGTGNSYYVAKQLSKALDLSMKPIHASGTIDSTIVEDSDESVGFVFPIYDFKAPKDMIEFIKRIKWNEGAYAFAVATYGVGSLRAYAKLCKEIASSHKSIAGGFGVMMPHNAVGSERLSEKNIQDLLVKSEADIQSLISKIQGRSIGDRMTTSVPELLKGNILKMTPAIGTLLYQLIIHGADSLKFQADNRCVGCGFCAQICPVKNIAIADNRPHWGDHCLGCFACIQWCEHSAITFGGKKLGVRKYTHPKVTFGEMKEPTRT